MIWGWMSITQAWTLKPAYERNLAGGKLMVGIFVVILAIGEIIIYWGLSSGRNPTEYLETAITFLILLPLAGYFVIQAITKGRKALEAFVNSTADLMKSWACIGPLVETGGYEAVCEFSNGCFVQCVFGALSVRKGSKGGILRVFKFVKGPETVSSAPIIKVKNDRKTLKTTRLPSSEKDFDSWRESETSWKRLVSMDEFIRSWVTAHLGWTTFRFSEPSPGAILHEPVVLCNDLYLRSPNHEGEWLKGKAIGVALNYVEPINGEEIKDFYELTITAADKIIEHVKEAI